jgi:hypothetical protein
MDWAGWAVFGLAATALLTSLLIGAQLAGWTRLDLPLLLGTLGPYPRFLDTGVDYAAVGSVAV